MNAAHLGQTPSPHICKTMDIPLALRQQANTTLLCSFLSRENKSVEPKEKKNVFGS